jgi:hypothetical protein
MSLLDDSCFWYSSMPRHDGASLDKRRREVVVLGVLATALVLILVLTLTLTNKSSSSSSAPPPAPNCTLTNYQNNTLNSNMGSTAPGYSAAVPDANATACASLVAPEVVCLSWVQNYEGSDASCQTPGNCCWLAFDATLCASVYVVANTFYAGASFTGNSTCA